MIHSTAWIRSSAAVLVLVLGCGPSTDDPQGGGDGGSSSTGQSADEGDSVTGSSTSGGETSAATSAEGETGGSSTGTSDNTCAALAQQQWTNFDELSGQTCGDMTIVGVSADRTALLVVSVPPILGTPWDENWESHATYALPDVDVVALVAHYDAPFEVDAAHCIDGGTLPDGALEVHDVHAELDFYLLDRDEIGCIFTCDNVYAELDEASIDCDGEQVLLGSSDGDSEPGTIRLHGFAELP